MLIIDMKYMFTGVFESSGLNVVNMQTSGSSRDALLLSVSTVHLSATHTSRTVAIRTNNLRAVLLVARRIVTITFCPANKLSINQIALDARNLTSRN